MRGLRAALAFLTRLPSGRLEAEDFACAPAWFGVVGLLIGALLALVFVVADALWPATLAALVTVAAGLLITGGLHEDGVADVFDGLGSGRPKERALEIMRDSRIGSFGALALGLALAARILALAALGPLVVVSLIAGQGLSRVMMALLLRAGPYARASGAATGMTGPFGPQGAAVLGATLLVSLALMGYHAGWAVFGGLAGLILSVWLVRLWMMRRIGGLTGDAFGAAQVLGDVGFLLGLLACL
ncbi:adenosylcobinamide-GDP ribazoletransferase [Pararhodobacter sp.]|uniref:adenosylcobinamide-GDP ribazoletransferase n=1 Tax=Pararhodobacter sp. TaxID=2127056 RepID=UPI002AFEE076|nr:adenosylcobinamide-GDP ribazoletransferase [Pararhodobacter sp.]